MREVEMSRAELNGQVASGSPHYASHVPTGLSVFDRFATRVSRFVSRAWFLMMCVLPGGDVAPSYLLLPDVDSWQLIINTVTTIVAFRLVALLQNMQKRADEAIQHKLNPIANGLADPMSELDKDHLQTDGTELRNAVGLEERESTTSLLRVPPREAMPR